MICLGKCLFLCHSLTTLFSLLSCLFQTICTKLFSLFFCVKKPLENLEKIRFPKISSWNSLIIACELGLASQKYLDSSYMVILILYKHFWGYLFSGRKDCRSLCIRQDKTHVVNMGASMWNIWAYKEKFGNTAARLLVVCMEPWVAMLHAGLFYSVHVTFRNMFF